MFQVVHDIYFAKTFSFLIVCRRYIQVSIAFMFKYRVFGWFENVVFSGHLTFLYIWNFSITLLHSLTV